MLSIDQISSIFNSIKTMPQDKFLIITGLIALYIVYLIMKLFLNKPNIQNNYYECKINDKKKGKSK